MKRMGRMLACAMLLTMLGCLEMAAQTLVIRLADGTTADVNRDNAVDVADIATIISIMAGGSNKDHAPAGAKGVDLGLPSGTLWANMNVGAEKPEDYGLYFAWGETKGYTSDTSDGRIFDWASYKWMNEGQSSWKYINKYQIDDGQKEGCWYQYLYLLVATIRSKVETDLFSQRVEPVVGHASQRGISGSSG